MQTFYHVIISCATVIGAITVLLYTYRGIFVLLGLFVTKRYPVATGKHRYGIVIAARNEERVLDRLLESINSQDYPSEKLTVFVVADNCTDNTASVARDHGAICYERTDSVHCTKGYALEFLFVCIERDYGRCSFDGYIVLDADNLLSHDYISRMNDAFDAGEKIVTSYRNTKNFDRNWISYSYGIHFLGTTRNEHRARSYLGFSTRLQGTGYLFTSELVQNGWHHTTLTEDRELTAAAVCRGMRVGYQHEAVFYDEQPISLRIALRQRLRWARGNLIVFSRVGGKLLKEMLRRLFRPQSGEHRFRDSFICYDVFMITFPETLLLVIQSLLLGIGTVGLALYPVITLEAVLSLLPWIGEGLIGYYIARLAISVYVTVAEHKRMPAIPLHKKIIGCLLWPLFPLIGDISILIAAFRGVEWKPIPHTEARSIDYFNQVK